MEKTSAGTNRGGEVYNAERDPGGAPTAIAIASRRVAKAAEVKSPNDLRGLNESSISERDASR